MNSFERNKAWLPHAQERILEQVDDARVFVARMFVEHKLEILTANRQFSLLTKSAWFGRTGLIYLDYGSHVEISPGPLEGFHLIQIPLAGSSTLRIGNRRMEANTTTATIPPTDKPSTMHWYPKSPHLCIYIPQQRVDEMAAELYGVEGFAGLKLQPTLDLSTREGQRFKQAIVDFHHDVQEPSPLPRLPRLSEEALVGRLLAASVNSLSQSLDIWPSFNSAPHTGRSKNLAHEFEHLVHAHFSEDVTIADFAERLAVSMRALQIAVAKEFQTTPTGVLVGYRLDRVRELLESPEFAHCSIAELALRCGFTHQGRFSTAYRHRFGQTPRQTRALS